MYTVYFKALTMKHHEISSPYKYFYNLYEKHSVKLYELFTQYYNM